MSKRLTHELTYDAPLSAVSAMLLDPAFREEVCAKQHVLRADVSVEETSGTTVVVIDQAMPAEGIPSFAKKFVGDEIAIVQTERWATEDRASVEVTIPGKPGEVRGTVTLTEAGGVTTETLDLDVRVSIPLVGGKIETLIADMLRKAVDTENVVGRDYLSR
jgi:hypothetical protein